MVCSEEEDMKTYRVGIVGFGWVAGAHLASFAKLANYEPVAIVSRRNLDPASIKEEYGVDVRIYHDFDSLIADDTIDIVDICTPHFLHPEQTIGAAEAHKHVIIEKPIALSYDDSLKMLEAVQKSGVKTSVCFEVRFIGASLAMKSIIENGLIGDLYYGEADYYHGIGPWYANQRWEVEKKNGGSSLLRAGCHALDMLLWLVHDEVVEVFSYSNKNPHEVYRPYDYDLNTVTLLKFRSGIIGKVSSVTDCMQPYTFNLNMLGSHGSIKNDRFFSKKIEGMEGWARLDVQLIDSGDVSNHPYVQQFAHFAECLDAKKDPHNNLENAVETHRVIFAADRSAEEGRPVDLKE
jgi:predicted dehydrogenase